MTRRHWRRVRSMLPAATQRSHRPHHMPSHIFTRAGACHEAIERKIASAAAGRKENATSEELHAMDYMVYAYLQTAQDNAAKTSVDQIAAIGSRIQMNAAGAAAPPSAGYYAWAV